MNFRTIRSLVLATSIACGTPYLAQAQAASAISPGMQVFDPAGGLVGTVTTVQSGEIIVKTDKHEVLLPTTSFTPDGNKLLFALTRDQLNAQTEEAIAEANASLVAGVPVRGTGGELAGHIQEIDATSVTLKLTSGGLLEIPRDSIAPSETGAVLGVSAEELRQMATQGS